MPAHHSPPPPTLPPPLHAPASAPRSDDLTGPVETRPWADRGAEALSPLDLALVQVLSDPEQAMSSAQQAWALASAQGQPVPQALALLVQALVGLRQTDTDQALARLAQARALTAAHPDTRAELLAQHVHAQWLRAEDRGEDALVLLLALQARAHERPGIDAFHTLMALGTVQALSEQRMADALASYYAGVDLAHRLGHAPLLVNALNNLGALQLDLHNLEDAAPLLRRCLDGALAVGSRRQRIFAAGNLVCTLSAMGQTAEVLALARAHLIGVVRPDDPPALQRDEEIALALLDNGLLDEAARYIERTPRPDVLTNPTTAMRAWLQARLLLADGHAAQALTVCRAHMHLVDDESLVPSDRLRLCQLSAQSAAACGDHALAYAWQCRVQGLQDHQLGRAAKARFVSLQLAHDLQGARRERDAAFRIARELEAANAALQAQVAANEALHQRLKALAQEDALTGLANRRRLFEVVPAWVQRAGATGQALSVALLDLDHFKSVNDQHGHDAGDTVLRRFAELAGQMLRTVDLCCRYGGEEFVIVWPGWQADRAQRMLQALQAEFTAVRFEGSGGTDFGASFSAGVCEAPADGLSLPALLGLADQALYQAKRAGRARVVRARPRPEQAPDAAAHIDADNIAR